MNESITLPLTYHEASYWGLVLGFVLISGLLYGALSLKGGERDAPAWEGISAGWLAILLPLALVWVALFAMTLGAALIGAWKAISDPKLATLGLGGLIAALLGAPFVIWGTVLKYQTVRYQKEGHMTDRISKAVEQLGAEKTVKKDGKEETVPNLEVRMGAILSLERIAQDSTMHDKGRDHVMVMQILCEYIRENSNARKPQEHDLGEWEPLKDDATPEELEAHLEALGERTEAIREWARSLPKPRADVQLALKVIGRRSAAQRRAEAAWPNPPDTTTRWPFDPDFKRLPDKAGEAATTIEQIESFKAGLQAWKKSCDDYRGYRLDLRGANLQGAGMAAGQPDGSDAVFSGARLDRARMEGASLDWARLECAVLIEAGMEGAILFGARMEGASFLDTEMQGVSLAHASMQGARLYRARMEGARLSGARMQGVYLEAAIMEGVPFVRARMEGASLRMVRIDGARLHEARMEGADLEWARLVNATLREIDLTSVIGLTWDTLYSTFGDGSVTLPEGLERPAHWPKQALGWQAFHTELALWRASPSTYTPPD